MLMLCVISLVSFHKLFNVLQLNEALEESRAEVARLHTERDRYEENMKKAFMRGVCALNMEAMTMFNESGT